MFGGYLNIVARSTAIYMFIIIAVKLFGNKELGQLSVIDLIFILLISNSVQNAMVGSDTSLLGGLIAATSLFVFNYLFKVLLFYFPRVSDFIQGETLMLIYDGKVNKANVRKAKITEEELMEAIREHGVSSIEQVDLAVLEIDGNISVLSDEFKHRTIKKRRIKKVVDK